MITDSSLLSYYNANVDLNYLKRVGFLSMYRFCITIHLIMFHADKFHFSGVSPCTKTRGKNSSGNSNFDGAEEWIASDSTLFDSLNSFSLAEDEPEQEELIHFDDGLYLDVLSPPFQWCGDEISRIVDAELINPRKRSPCESFEVLRKISEKISNMAHARNPSLSIEMMIKIAAENFIHSISDNRNELSMLNHPCSSSILTLSNESSKEVHLVQNLLSCAEKITEKNYECSIRFLKDCGGMCTSTGTPIQRLAFYVSEALFQKIAQETGKRNKVMKPLEPPKLANSMPVYFKHFPVSQITNLVGSYTILCCLEGSRKIHVVDLEIRSGVQWVQLMQDLSARTIHPIEHLKITAIGLKSKSILEETGRQLANFAHSVNLNFSFRIVMVDDILDLNIEMFDIDSDEAVAVYASYTLITLTGRGDSFHHVMEIIKGLSPRAMIVTEVEANCSSTLYMERFVESLFLFGAFFDSLAECLKGEDTSRMDIESTLFRSSLNHILTAEGEEMVLRHLPINKWRAIFGGFGLVEMELSFSSLNQAKLLLQNNVTLCRNDRCLIVGWKGIALTSLSAWKVGKSA